MGLDMYVYRINTITKEKMAKYNGQSAEDFPYAYYIILEKGEPFPEELAQVRPFGQIGNLMIPDFDMEQIRKDYKIPKTAQHIGSVYLDDTIIFSFSYRYRGQQRKKAEIPADLAEKKYARDSLEEVFALDTGRDVCYWRNRWDLQEKLCELMPCIENCGFYVLTDEMIELICKDSPEYMDLFSNADEDDVFVYHPWW